MEKKRIRIGTRSSRLAIIQTELAEQALKVKFPDLKIERRRIETQADLDRKTPLFQFGQTGVFSKELEQALLLGEIDLAVHSAKDLSVSPPLGLCLSGVLKRGDVRDVLVYRKGSVSPLQETDEIMRIGTDSPRRSCQLEKNYAQIRCVSIRGNVPTRLEKLRSGEYDGVMLAVCGLQRLNMFGLKEFQYHVFSEEEILPAGGQAIIALETRKDGEAAKMAEAIRDESTFLELRAEQQVLKLLDAGCHEPIAVRAKAAQGRIRMTALKAQGEELIRIQQEDTEERWEELAKKVAGFLL